jgi:predicted HAD superfamily Cof-like phosphohydrolase
MDARRLERLYDKTKKFIRLTHMRSQHQKQVDQFMRLAQQDVPRSVTIPSEEVRLLRAKLTFEECMEKLSALGVTMRFGSFEFHPGLESSVDPVGWTFEITDECDIIEVVDACCDINVVSTGTLSAFGVDDVLPQLAVNMSNLRKFDQGGHKREDGKWIKPPLWQPPDIPGILAGMGWQHGHAQGELEKSQ